MGEQNVQRDDNERSHPAFMQSLLTEVRALDWMLATDMIESGVRRIGAEQEMFIVDRAFGPAPQAVEILRRIGDSRFTHELGLFNLEANLSPRELSGDCLGRRLWHDARIAVFENSVDTRSTVHQARGQHPRVHFGDRWINESVTGT